ncbi:REP-associated tyrosine transposase (plasmid) [Methylomonas sp. MED-D]|uniref:REP-associated tyrosine transposase n=1 Tax=Methylomonas sp. MED-D TaxID=3418768 RepID=UPI003CFD77B5
MAWYVYTTPYQPPREYPPLAEADRQRMDLQLFNELAVNGSAKRIKRRKRGLWQRRYWEHLIRDEADFQAHLNYIRYNPVKHGWVKQVKDWPFSTFHRWIEQSIYSLNWAGIDGDLYEFE